MQTADAVPKDTINQGNEHRQGHACERVRGRRAGAGLVKMHAHMRQDAAKPRSRALASTQNTCCPTEGHCLLSNRDTLSHLLAFVSSVPTQQHQDRSDLKAPYKQGGTEQGPGGGHCRLVLHVPLLSRAHTLPSRVVYVARQDFDKKIKD